MYKIKKKILEDNLEILPGVEDTPIWKDYDQTDCCHSTKLYAELYSAIAKRENKEILEELGM